MVIEREVMRGESRELEQGKLFAFHLQLFLGDRIKVLVAGVVF